MPTKLPLLGGGERDEQLLAMARFFQSLECMTQPKDYNLTCRYCGHHVESFVGYFHAEDCPFLLGRRAVDAMRKADRDRPKPAPTPPYAERLIAAVRAGEFQLPIEDSEYTQLRYEADAGRKSWAWWDREWQVTRHIIPQTSGRPPEWQPGDSTTIDLQPIRDALRETK